MTATYTFDVFSSLAVSEAIYILEPQRSGHPGEVSLAQNDDNERAVGAPYRA